MSQTHHRKCSNHRNSRSGIYVDITGGTVRIVVTPPRKFQSLSHHRKCSHKEMPYHRISLNRSCITGNARIVVTPGLNRIYLSMPGNVRIVVIRGPEFVSASPEMFESQKKQFRNLCGHHRKGSNRSHTRYGVCFNITRKVFVADTSPEIFES